MRKLKNKLKVLQLSRWMEIADFEEDDRFIEIKPRFNRNGYYLRRGQEIASSEVWVEINGKAYINAHSNDATQFEYEIALYGHRPLRIVEANALQLLVLNHIANKDMKTLYYNDSTWKQHNEVRASATRSSYIFRKSLKLKAKKSKKPLTQLHPVCYT